MEVVREVIGWLIAASGFVIWALFLPQVRLLYKVKTADSISLGTIYGSLAIQTLIFLHALLGGDFKLSFLQSTSMFFLGLIIGMIHYYRRFPGGRSLASGLLAKVADN